MPGNKKNTEKKNTEKSKVAPLCYYLNIPLYLFCLGWGYLFFGWPGAIGTALIAVLVTRPIAVACYNAWADLFGNDRTH